MTRRMIIKIFIIGSLILIFSIYGLYYMGEYEKAHSFEEEIEWYSDILQDYQSNPTNREIEWGLRADGVIVWRKGE